MDGNENREQITNIHTPKYQLLHLPRSLTMYLTFQALCTLGWYVLQFPPPKLFAKVIYFEFNSLYIKKGFSCNTFPVYLYSLHAWFIVQSMFGWKVSLVALPKSHNFIPLWDEFINRFSSFKSRCINGGLEPCNVATASITYSRMIQLYYICTIYHNVLFGTY